MRMRRLDQDFGGAHCLSTRICCRTSKTARSSVRTRSARSETAISSRRTREVPRTSALIIRTKEGEQPARRAISSTGNSELSNNLRAISLFVGGMLIIFCARRLPARNDNPPAAAGNGITRARAGR